MKLGIYCSGSLGIEVLSLVMENAYIYDEILFIDDITNQTEICGKRVLKFSDVQKSIKNNEIKVVIAAGEPVHRERLYSVIKQAGYVLGMVQSNKAYVSSNVELGEGVIIFPNTYVGATATVKDNVVIHAGANIVEGSVIENHSFISLGVFIGSGSNIGKASFVGPNAAISDHLRVGDRAIIGMGSVVLKDVKGYSVNVGNPSRMIKEDYDSIIFKEKNNTSTRECNN